MIIDDPLLRARYGGLKFKELQKQLHAGSACASLAFIPWNWRRSHRRIVEMFRRDPEHLSLSVHGCDHTRGEFGGTDENELAALSYRAIERMDRHRELTGIPFDKVMVFPQGIFSSVAMTALRRAGFFAAVNTSAHSIDGVGPTLRDVLSPAVMCYGGGALFLRRYPREVAEIALDLFLGKPALLVEHHGFFSDGCDEFARFVGKMNSLQCDLRWEGLGSTCEKAHLRKLDGQGDEHIRFFGERFRFQNNLDVEQDYIFRTLLGAVDEVDQVTINGSELDFSIEGSDIVFARRLAPQEQLAVRIVLRLPSRPHSWRSPKISHQCRVFIRRILCEFRDSVAGR